MNKLIAIGCTEGCNGEKMQCLEKIIKTCLNGDTGFMMYSDHVHDKLLQMNCFNIDVFKKDEIPIGMYIKARNTIH